MDRRTTDGLRAARVPSDAAGEFRFAHLQRDQRRRRRGGPGAPNAGVGPAAHQRGGAIFVSLTFRESGVGGEGVAGPLRTPAGAVTAIELGSGPAWGAVFGPTATPGSIDDQGASFTIRWHSAHAPLA